jgi:hypothetical protein
MGEYRDFGREDFSPIPKKEVDPVPNIKSPAQNNILVSPENYKLLVDEGLMWAVGSMITATMRGESFEILQFPFKPGKHPDFPCPTKDCPGDERYAAPGRGHLTTCKHPTPQVGMPEYARGVAAIALCKKRDHVLAPGRNACYECQDDARIAVDAAKPYLGGDS